jgi:hypothetical protein
LESFDDLSVIFEWINKIIKIVDEAKIIVIIDDIVQFEMIRIEILK